MLPDVNDGDLDGAGEGEQEAAQHPRGVQVGHRACDDQQQSKCGDEVGNGGEMLHDAANGEFIESRMVIEKVLARLTSPYHERQEVGGSGRCALGQRNEAFGGVLVRIEVVGAVELPFDESRLLQHQRELGGMDVPQRER